jgi:hypothetical protein
MAKSWAILVTTTLVVSGCGVKEDRAKHAGQAVGETLTDFTRGVGAGVHKAATIDVELSDKLTDMGLSKTIAKQHADFPIRSLTVYMLSQQPVADSLIAKALNAEGEEIGRSIIDVEFAADDAKYVTFDFDEKLDSQLIERYVIDVRPAAQSRPSTTAGTHVEAEE